VTEGAGHVDSHVVLGLDDAEWPTIVVGNLSIGTAREPTPPTCAGRGDVGDPDLLERVRMRALHNCPSQGGALEPSELPPLRRPGAGRPAVALRSELVRRGLTELPLIEFDRQLHAKSLMVKSGTCSTPAWSRPTAGDRARASRSSAAAIQMPAGTRCPRGRCSAARRI
jgi:hypothetical protein